MSTKKTTLEDIYEDNVSYLDVGSPSKLGQDPINKLKSKGPTKGKSQADLYQESLPKAKSDAEVAATMSDDSDGSDIIESKDYSSGKSSGPKSYKTAYADAGGAAELGDYAKWEKKAKDWNTKKYGTTEPTAKAAKFTGGSKTKLAEAAKPVKMERKEATPIATSTPNNNRMQRTIANANNPASLVGGTQTRREKRQADRKINRDNKAANKLRLAGQKATTQRTNKERRQDSRQDRGDKRFEKRTGISMSGTPSSSPQLDTGPGTYQGAKKAESEKKKNWRSSLSNKTFGM
jgi:hypothetical protein